MSEGMYTLLGVILGFLLHLLSSNYSDEKLIRGKFLDMQTTITSEHKNVNTIKPSYFIE